MELNSISSFFNGANGFTAAGSRNTSNATYPDRPWAMPVASHPSLRRVRDRDGLPADTPLIEADASDPETSLDAMVATGRGWIITTVGPYLLYANPRRGLCQSWHDYSTCRRPPFNVGHDRGKYNDLPKPAVRGSCISCGCDSIPFDMGVYFLQTRSAETLWRARFGMSRRPWRMKGDLLLAGQPRRAKKP